MKPHRYRDLLRDLASIPLHPDMSIGRRMEEMGEVLQRHVGAPEHGNRGEEIDTLVIVPEHEIARLQAQLAQAERVVVPECGYRFNTHCLCAVPASRVLKDGEVGVDAETMQEIVNSVEFMASFECQCDTSVGHICKACWASRLIRKLDALRAQGKEGAS